MKKFSFLLSIAMTLLFTQCVKNEISLDPIPPEPYSKPLVVEAIYPNGGFRSRTIYTYNSKGLETGIKADMNYERTNYKYEGKRCSYTDMWGDYKGNRLIQTECIMTFWDTKYTRPLSVSNITTYNNGDVEREVYIYNSEGLETSYKKYVNEILYMDRINYKYEGMKSSYTEIEYATNGETVSLNTYSATFEDINYKRPLVIENVWSFPAHVEIYSQRTVFSYNAQGLVTSRKSYQNDNMVNESKDYTYEDKKSSYNLVYYDGHSSMMVNTTYLY